MSNISASKAKLQEVGFGGDGDAVVGVVTAPEVIVHLTAADMHFEYDAALLIVQSSKARQNSDLVSRTELFLKGAEQLCITSHS